MLRYAILDATYRPGTAHALATKGVDILQLRLKQSPAREQLTTAQAILEEIRNTPTKLLINNRPDIALAAGAHGVHLTSSPDELTAKEVRTLFAKAEAPAPILSRSTHTLAEVQQAAADDIPLILLGPIFEKVTTEPGAPHLEEMWVSRAPHQRHEGIGLESLHKAAQQAPGRILALGGVTDANTPACLAAGAAGIAAIRLFR